MTLPRELIEALDSRAGDPRRFIDASELAQFRRYPRATPAQIERAEGLIGFPRPDGLPRLYLDVANGGFGPGYGILGIDNGATDDIGGNVEEICAQLAAFDPQVPEWQWREQVVPPAGPGRRSLSGTDR